MTETVQFRKSHKPAVAPMVIVDATFLREVAKDAFRQFFVPITAAFRTPAIDKVRVKRTPSRRRS
ncbi:hypothetical protein [Brevundimonas sp.]|uniref:hypothetical protein n=1 Tax=Brevundimonas sp. TaxID=1871086 RepID=UPI002D51AB88|nr:hypothetical protein [Brevundimonas sp.]HYC99287.1 hypothetical protein [Brevundimonas sp.]